MPSDLRFVLHVIGPPEIQARPSAETEDGMYESIGWAGEPVHRLKSRFCSRPPPRIVAWQWGSSHIRAGECARDFLSFLLAFLLLGEGKFCEWILHSAARAWG